MHATSEIIYKIFTLTKFVQLLWYNFEYNYAIFVY